MARRHERRIMPSIAVADRSPPTSSPRSPKSSSCPNAAPITIANGRRPSNAESPALSTNSNSPAHGGSSYDSPVVIPDIPDMPFFVTCVHSFKPADENQLAFRKGYILEVVRTEQSGWWAAKRYPDGKIGWVPRAFVRRISTDAVMQHVMDDLRSPERAARTMLADLAASPLDGEILFKDVLSPTSLVPTRDFPTPVTPWSIHPVHSNPPVRGLRIVTNTKLLPSPPSVVTSSNAEPWTCPSASQKGKAPLKLNTNVSLLPQPNVSPLTFADAFDFVPAYGRVHTVANSSPDSTDDQASSPVLHPYAREQWTPPPLDSPGTSSTSSSLPPQPSPPRLHIEIPQLPPRKGSSTDPLKAFKHHAPSRSLQGSPTPHASPFGRSRSKSALAVAPSPTAARPRPHRIGTDSPAVDHGERRTPLSPRASAPDLKRSTSLGQGGRVDSLRRTSPTLGACVESPISPSPQPRSGGSGKVLQLTGDRAAQALVAWRERQSRLEWFLRPQHVEGRDIVVDSDDNVKAGTLEALVERLTVEGHTLLQETLYKETFLATFKSFATAEQTFDLLVAQFAAQPPADLSQNELVKWHEQRQKPAQLRVLEVLRSWVERHHMLVEDPEVAGRLRPFLVRIKSPPVAALQARQIMQSLEHLKARAAEEARATGSLLLLNRKRVRQPLVTDIFKLDFAVAAQQLALYEERLYSRIRPQECVRYSKGMKGHATANLTAFCMTSDQLAAWVKMSVLDLKELHKRADALDYWIKVASKCMQLNNLSSMTSIVAALASVDLSRLERTWESVSSPTQKTFEQLEKMMDAQGNYGALRQFLQAADGPCVPFIPMYLRDLLHVHDGFPEHVNVADGAVEPGSRLINFAKRRQTAQIVNTLLRHQEQHYPFAEDASISAFIQDRLALGAGQDHNTFWARSQDIRRQESAFVDIKRQIEMAGF